MSEAQNSEKATGIPSGFLPWLVLGVGTVICMLLLETAPWLKAYPADWVVPLADSISQISSWFGDNFKWLFRWISWFIDIPMQAIQGLLSWLPWPATISFFVLFAFKVGDWKLALFTFLALFYMVFVGYWDESMSTLALVAISVHFRSFWGSLSAFGRSDRKGSIASSNRCST